VRAATSTAEGREAGSSGTSAASDPVRLSVLEASGDGVQLGVVTNGPIRSDEDTTITITGAGFSVPAWSEANPNIQNFVDVGLVNLTDWTPESGAITRVDGITYSMNTWTDGQGVSESTLRREQGTFTFTATIPAGTLDPTASYGIGSRIRSQDSSTNTSSWSLRDGDAWAPVTLADAPAAEFDPQESDLTDDNRGSVTVPESAHQGDTITVTVGQELAGQTVRAVLFSDPLVFDPQAVSEEGTMSVTVPAETAEGEHRLAVYAEDGSVLGWDDLLVVAAAEGSSDPEGAAEAEGNTDAEGTGGAEGTADAEGTPGSEGTGGADDANANHSGSASSASDDESTPEASQPTTAAAGTTQQLSSTGAGQAGAGVLGATLLITLAALAGVLARRRRVEH
ncbi:MAG: hypothetical protein ACTJHU_09875, partial [Mycetocola sp.]